MKTKQKNISTALAPIASKKVKADDFFLTIYAVVKSNYIFLFYCIGISLVVLLKISTTYTCELAVVGREEKI